jgi:phage major head subunit gpT-like protein
MAGQITKAQLDALRTQIEIKWNAAYQNIEVWAPKISTEVPSSARSNTYGWKAMQTTLREWIGPRVALNLSEHAYEIVNKKYEGTLEVDRTEIDDDNIGIFTGMQIPDLAQATKKHPDQLLAALIKANPTAFDGKALFADDHPTYAPAAYTQTYDNNFTAALDADGVNTVYSTMASYLGENGQPLVVRPDTLIVPPQLRRAAMAINNSATSALPGAGAGDPSATIDNPMRGWFKQIIEIPELADQPDTWYMADMSKVVKPFVYQLRDAPELVSRQNLDDPKVFDLDKFTWGVRVRHNVGVSLPFLIAKAVQP